MEMIILIILTSILNIICFFLGAKIGQKVINNESLDLKIPTPIKLIKEYEENKENERIQEKEDVILHNIETYDGTSIGQRDIPR